MTLLHCFWVSSLCEAQTKSVSVILKGLGTYIINQVKTYNWINQKSLSNTR